MTAATSTHRLDETAELKVLRGILTASTDACWCMEFAEPVDLTAPDTEVVRQVFDNGPVWRHCNPAMAQLYHLPPDKNLHSRPVAEIFPRSPQNEAFVQNLLSNGFEVDAAPALDLRYDGVEIHVENDVRAHISDGRLLRMFGIVRDVGKHFRREAALAFRAVNAEHFISLLPDPVVGIDAALSILQVNPAAEALLDRSEERLIGQNLPDVLTSMSDEPGAHGLIHALGSAPAGGSGNAVIADLDCAWTLSRMADTGQGALTSVLMFRPKGSGK